MSFTKTIISGDVIEVYEYERKIKSTGLRKRRVGGVSRRVVFALSQRPDSIRRRTRAFRRLLQSNLVGEEIPALFTFTMLEVVTLREAYVDFQHFIARVRRYEGKGFKYIAVPEFQQRGAIHFHVLIWGIEQERVLGERNSRYFQRLWQKGFVDCIQTDGSPKLIGYVGKYLSKSMSDRRLYNQRAYLSSHNVLRSVSVNSLSPIDYSKEVFDIDLSTVAPLIDRKFNTYWLGKGHYKLFNLSQ